MASTLADIILKEQRMYFIEKVKAPLIKVLVSLASHYPEPTMERVTHPNDKVLLGIWDKFFEAEDNGMREDLFKAIRKVTIGEQAHDPYYRDRMQVFFELWLEEVLKGNWKPRSLDHPVECWKADPNKRGLGYEFIVDRFYHKAGD